MAHDALDATPDTAARQAGCVVCGSEGSRFLYPAEDRYYGVPGTFAVHECAGCGLLFLKDPPTGEALGKYYPSNYYAYGGARAPTRRERFRAHVQRERYRASYDPTFRGPRRWLYRLVTYGGQLRSARLVPGTRHLDVGCGGGDFLDFARGFGVETYGVEPGPEGAAAARARGLDVKTGTLTDAGYPDRFFDLVTLNHVFEHVPDPRESLAEIHRILKDDGEVVIAVPNAASLARHLFGTCWVQLDAPRHLYLYSPRTLRRLAEAHGFQVDRTRWVGLPFQFTGSLRYALNRFRREKKLLTAPGGFMNKPSVNTALRPVTGLLNWLRLGDTIEVVLRKAPPGTQRR